MDVTKLRRHATPAGITLAWIAALLVAWRIVVSFDRVRSAVSVLPFESSLYPMGLMWTSLIDAIFLTFVIALIIQFGRQLAKCALEILPGLQSVRSALLSASIMAATCVGYFAYDELVLEPLRWIGAGDHEYFFEPSRWQGAGWVYQLAFWLLIAGASIAILLQGVRFWYEIDSCAPRFVQAIGGRLGRQAASRSPSIITLSPPRTEPEKADPLSAIEPRPTHCMECGAELPLSARFCIMCGQEVSAS